MFTKNLETFLHRLLKNEKIIMFCVSTEVFIKKTIKINCVLYLSFKYILNFKLKIKNQKVEKNGREIINFKFLLYIKNKKKIKLLIMVIIRAFMLYEIA